MRRAASSVVETGVVETAVVVANRVVTTTEDVVTAGSVPPKPAGRVVDADGNATVVEGDESELQAANANKLPSTPIQPFRHHAMAIS